MSSDDFVEICNECRRTFLKEVNFAFLRFGKECISGSSHSFTEATCNASVIKSDYNCIMTGKFKNVFRQGIMVLKNLKSDDSQMKDQRIFSEKKKRKLW